MSVSAQNLTFAQQQANVMWQAATVQGINVLMNTSNAVTGKVVIPKYLKFLTANTVKIFNQL
ncbi:RebB family R body protein [Pseudoalteromonas holothuriae]|uniref:RebB family R body protein n=1 Tax=Pseudoalteromonas holothuriae TaxID=2963714 RepID=UPI003965B780